MTAQLIGNPNNAFGQPAPNIQGSAALTNEDVTVWTAWAAYATPQYGDVVTSDVTGTIANTTTTAADVNVVGVVSQKPTPGTSAGKFNISTSTSGFTTIPVITSGPARIQIGANTVTTGAFLVSSTTAGSAQASATPTIGTVIAIAKESSTSADSASTIRCWVVKC